MYTSLHPKHFLKAFLLKISFFSIFFSLLNIYFVLFFLFSNECFLFIFFFIVEYIF